MQLPFCFCFFSAPLTAVSVQPPLGYDDSFTLPAGNQTGPFTAIVTPSFNPQLTGSITYSWVFGDGTSIQHTPTTSLSHFYSSPGSYLLSVAATNPVSHVTSQPVDVTVYQGE